MSAQLVTVGSVLKAIVSGKSLKTLERRPVGDEHGILKVSAVTWGEFRPGESKAMPADYAPGDCPRPMDGDILISRANTRDLVGAPVIVRGNHPRLLLSDKLLKLIPDETVVDRNYLVRALRSAAAMAHFSSRAGGSSGSMTNITQSDIREAPILLPKLAEQRRIAAILDQADTLRSQRRKALNLLSDLRASIFASMFGSLDNPAFRLGSIRNYVDASSGKSSKGVVARERSAFPIYGGNGINGWATRALYDVPVLVFGRVGQQCGNAFLTDGPAWVTDNAIVVQIRNMDALHPRFVLDAFSHTDFARRVRHLDLPFINQSMILDTPIVLPQIALQLEYVERVVEVDRLSASHRASLAHLDALFASLQHRAFGGEL